jgi:hypothetical protein
VGGGLLAVDRELAAPRALHGAARTVPDLVAGARGRNHFGRDVRERALHAHGLDPRGAFAELRAHHLIAADETHRYAELAGADGHDLALADRRAADPHLAEALVRDGVRHDSGRRPRARVVTDEQDDSGVSCEPRHRGRAGPARSPHHAAARVDLVEHQVTQLLDAVVLLDHDLGRARVERARDRRVGVLGHEAAVALEVHAGRDHVSPAHEPRDPFHVDREPDLHD